MLQMHSSHQLLSAHFRGSDVSHSLLGTQTNYGVPTSVLLGVN